MRAGKTALVKNGTIGLYRFGSVCIQRHPPKVYANGRKARITHKRRVPFKTVKIAKGKIDCFFHLIHLVNTAPDVAGAV